MSMPSTPPPGFGVPEKRGSIPGDYKHPAGIDPDYRNELRSLWDKDRENFMDEYVRFEAALMRIVDERGLTAERMRHIAIEVTQGGDPFHPNLVGLVSNDTNDTSSGPEPGAPASAPRPAGTSFVSICRQLLDRDMCIFCGGVTAGAVWMALMSLVLS